MCSVATRGKKLFFGESPMMSDTGNSTLSFLLSSHVKVTDQLLGAFLSLQSQFYIQLVYKAGSISLLHSGLQFEYVGMDEAFTKYLPFSLLAKNFKKRNFEARSLSGGF